MVWKRPSTLLNAALCLFLLLIAASALFIDVETVPVILWDESRVAVNALELHLDGWNVVTTFDSKPDLWNTKPPLLVWLISASFALFGPSEFSLRLPSMLAALATLASVFFFTLLYTRKRHLAAIATIILAFSVIFFGEQAARTADYGALLTFLTTAYLMLLFGTIHQRRPSVGLIGMVAGLAALALMTKGVAALVPAVGLAGYLIVFGRWRRVLSDRRYIGFAFLALLPLAIFLIVREQTAPGFIAVSFFNDVGGRFNQDLVAQNRSPLFYLKALFVDGLFFLGPWTMLVPLAWLKATKRTRVVLSYSLWCAAGQIFVLSLAQTRLVHYALPAAPWLAIATAIATGELIDAIRSQLADGRRIAAIAAAAGCVMIAQQSAAFYAGARYGFFPAREFYPEAGYGALFEQLHEMKISEVTIAHDANVYAPQLQFYRTLWATRGLIIQTKPSIPATGAVASCEPRWAEALNRTGAFPARYAGCYWRPASRHNG
jgi:4-amino-4-deoxy-L-arabinose transferase-like glycosyltransferase